MLTHPRAHTHTIASSISVMDSSTTGHFPKSSSATPIKSQNRLPVVMYTGSCTSNRSCRSSQSHQDFYRCLYNRSLSHQGALWSPVVVLAERALIDVFPKIYISLAFPRRGQMLAAQFSTSHHAHSAKHKETKESFKGCPKQQGACTECPLCKKKSVKSE